MNFVNLTQDSWTTLVSALIGAIAALLVVAIQRSLERKDQRAKEEQERKAIAAALVYELAALHRSYVVAEHGLWRVSTDPFPVFLGNTQKLNLFDQSIAGDVVQLYARLDLYLGTLTESLRYRAEQYRGTPVSGLDRQSTEQAKAMARKLDPVVRNVCRHLCEVAAISFEDLHLTEAASEAHPTGA